MLKLRKKIAGTDGIVGDELCFFQAEDGIRDLTVTGVQTCALPIWTARRDFTARRLDRSVALPAVQGLRALGVKQGCSFFTVVLGALSILLARLSRERRFVIALPTAEQPVIGQPDLVGHCVSLLPFVVDLQEAETISDFLA